MLRIAQTKVFYFLRGRPAEVDDEFNAPQKVPFSGESEVPVVCSADCIAGIERARCIAG
jgi:hypothetical protein